MEQLIKTIRLLCVYVITFEIQILGTLANIQNVVFDEHNPKDKLEVKIHGRRLLETTEATSEPEKSFWDKVREFYDDKNNFAMYLVLPLIVFVYGGCCLIYCIAKCRRYIKNKKQSELLDNEEKLDEADDINERNNNNRKQEGKIQHVPSVQHVPSQVTMHRNLESPVNKTTVAVVTGAGARAASASEVKFGLDQDSNGSTPLPWQVPDENESPYQSKHEMATYNGYSPKHPNIQPLPKGHYGHNQQPNIQPLPRNDMHHQPHRGPDIQPLPRGHHMQQPQHLNVAKLRDQNAMKQPPSPPPPYDDNGHRRNSIDEIIVLGAAQQNAKRHQQMHKNDPKMRNREPPAYQSPAPNSFSSRPPKDPRAQAAMDTYYSSRPRDPKPPGPLDTYNTSKQAAQILGENNINRKPIHGYNKKPKRLVFVAE